MIEKLEKEMNEYIASKKVFRADRDLLIEKVVTEFEGRVRSILNVPTADSLTHKELDTLNTCIDLIYKYSKAKETKSFVFKENSIKDLYEDSEKYFCIKNIIYQYRKERIHLINQRENELHFRAVMDLNNENHQIEVLNYINKLKSYSEYFEKMKEHIMKEQKNNLNPYKMFRMAIDTYRYLPSDILIDGFTIDEIYDCIAILMAYSGSLIQTGVFFGTIEHNKLLERIQQMLNLEQDKVDKIIGILTYEHSDKPTDIIHTPLIKLNHGGDEPEYLISPCLILNSNVERNVYNLINLKYHDRYCGFTNKKESLMVKRLEFETRKYSNLIIESDKNLYKQGTKQMLTNLDFVMYDKIQKALLICELKDFIRADSASEHINVDGRREKEGLKKGINQIKLIADYFEHNEEVVLEKCFRNKSMEVDKVLCCIISKDNLGSRFIPKETNILDESNFINLLHKNTGDLLQTIKDIEEKNYYPKYNKDYWIAEKELEFCGYKIQIDEFRVKHIN